MSAVAQPIEASREPTPEERQQLLESIDLLGVFMMTSNVQCVFAPVLISPTDPIEIDVNLSCSWQIQGNDRLFFCYIRTIVTSSAREDGLNCKKGQHFFTIDVSHALTYQVREKRLEDRLYDWFAQSNAIFNAYPYIREAIDNFSRRMGVPPVTLPLLKPGAKIRLANENSPKPA